MVCDIHFVNGVHNRRHNGADYRNGVCTYRGALIASCLNWQNCLFDKPKLELNIYLVIQNHYGIKLPHLKICTLN